MSTISQALGLFATDLASQTALLASIPLVTESIPTDSASMSYSLNNPDQENLDIASSARTVTGQINIKISHALGTNDMTMLKLAEMVIAIYKRGVVLDDVTITSSYLSSIYSSDANRNINVIVEFFTATE